MICFKTTFDDNLLVLSSQLIGLFCLIFALSVFIDVHLVYPWFQLANNDLSLTPFSAEGFATLALFSLGGLLLTLGVLGCIAAVTVICC